jgi:hypothetical protein
MHTPKEAFLPWTHDILGCFDAATDADDADIVHSSHDDSTTDVTITNTTNNDTNITDENENSSQQSRSSIMKVLKRGKATLWRVIVQTAQSPYATELLWQRPQCVQGHQVRALRAEKLRCEI